MDPKLLILKTIEKFVQANPTGWLGRTAIQKLCYFSKELGSKELGAPFDVYFQMHQYGPYSERLAQMLFQLEIDDLIEDRSEDPARYSNFRLTPNGKQHLADKNGEVGA